RDVAPLVLQHLAVELGHDLALGEVARNAHRHGPLAGLRASGIPASVAAPTRRSAAARCCQQRQRHDRRPEGELAVSPHGSIPLSRVVASTARMPAWDKPYPK